MRLLPLILVIILSKAIFLLSLMEVTKRSEASHHRIAALDELVTQLARDTPPSEPALRRLEEEVGKHTVGPQLIPYDLSVASYMLIIPTSFWVFITSIRRAVKEIRH